MTGGKYMDELVSRDDLNSSNETLLSFSRSCASLFQLCSFKQTSRPAVARTTTRAQVTCDNKGVVADIEYR